MIFNLKSISHLTRIALFAILIAVILPLIDDYGLSWDEYSLEIYANQTIDVIEGNIPSSEYEGVLRFYGPFVVTSAEILGKIGSTIFPQIQKADFRHGFYAGLFFISLPFIHSLIKRIVPAPAAITGTLLYATQPVIWGHAFMNPKDTPFASLFIITIELGFRVWDNIMKTKTLARTPELYQDPKSIRSTWERISFRQRILILSTGILTIIAILEGLWIRFFKSLGIRTISLAYQGQAPSFIQVLFNRIATDAFKTPLPVYIEKFETAYFWFSIASITVLLLCLILVLGKNLTNTNWKRYKRISAAALILGITLSTRIFGLFAGALTSMYALLILRKKAVLPLILFWAIALAAMILTWPYLWDKPIPNFIASINQMINFEWPGNVLYNGHFLSTDELPWYTIPHLLIIQLTIPVLILVSLGILRLSMDRKPMPNRIYWLFYLSWVSIPILAGMFSATRTYDNFRQLIFSLPPLFILAAFGVDWIFSRLKDRYTITILIFATLVPGILGIVQLHPYEYIYYNQLVGGLSGASEKYEMDYWCTSTREATEYLNTYAPENAVIGVNTTIVQVAPFARSDLILVTTRTQEDLQTHIPLFIIICGRWEGERSFPGIKAIYTISRSGVNLGYISQPEIETSIE